MKQELKMQYSKIFASACLALISALVLVQASQYGANDNGGRYGPAQGGQHNSVASHYSASGCQGYQCNRQASQSSYGPYHSYAVRPVVYGGHGLYHYKGYARHPPAPGAHQRKQRYPRGYGAGPARGRPSRGPCYGRHCGRPQRHYAAPQRHYAQANSAYRRPQATGYSLRPVKAVVLAPASNNYNSRPAYGQHPQQHNGGYGQQQQQQQQQHNSAYGQQQGGYRHQAAAYGNGNGSNQYAQSNGYEHQQRGYNQGGQKASAGGY